MWISSRINKASDRSYRGNENIRTFYTTHFPGNLAVYDVLQAMRQSQLIWRKVTQTGCDLHANKLRRKHVAISLIIYAN
jgi:hypothetical protein